MGIFVYIIYPVLALAMLVPTWKACARIRDKRRRIFWRSLAAAAALTPVPIANVGFYPAVIAIFEIVTTALRGRFDIWQIKATVGLVGASWLILIGMALVGAGFYRYLMDKIYRL